MGWAKYDEDIRELVDERRMRTPYMYGNRSSSKRAKGSNQFEISGSYMKETRIVKRPY